MSESFNDIIMGSYFVEENLPMGGYLPFLWKKVLLVLLNTFPNVNNHNLPDDSIWLKQDGAPPHYARDIREFLV